MSTERDFDRLARAWLELGPNEAPDRAIDAALDAIEVTPQVRRPLRWPFWRPTVMSRLPLLAALAGIVIIVAGLLLVTGGGPTPPIQATPSPLASASEAAASSSPLPLPAAIGGSWVAASRGTGLEDAKVTTITLESPNEGTPIAFWIDRNGFNPILPALAEEVAPGQIEFRSTTSTGSCETGAVGRYGWALSTDGQWLSIDLVEDACADRATILPGSWQRSLAHANPGGPGIAAIFEPYFTFTLPPGTYAGRGTADIDSLVTETGTTTYKVWRDLDGFVDACDIDAGRIDLEGMDGVLGYLEEDPRFAITERDEFTIDGHPAVEVRFTIGADIDPPCWSFDGDQADPTGVLTWVPHAWAGGFWNDRIGATGLLVVTEVDGVSLTFEAVEVTDPPTVDRATLETIRFLDELPAPPGS
jgi:hypothetical protein